jgi:hypothetical protein
MLPLEAQTTLVLASVPLTLHAPGLKESLSALDAAYLSLDRRGSSSVSIEGAPLDFWLIEIGTAAA